MEWLDALRGPLKIAVLPPGGIILLLLLGLLLRRRFVGWLFSVLGITLLYLMSVSATSDWLARQLETHPAVSSEQVLAEGAQAILEFSAGLRHITPELDWQARPNGLSQQRMAYAVKLHRDTGLPIIISGGVLSEGDAAIADVLGRWLREQMQISPLALETRSKTTWENAEFSAPLLRELGIERVALVTHAFHMSRAMHSAAAHRIDAIAAPTGFLAYPHKSENGYQDTSYWTPAANTFAENYLLLHELIGNQWYGLKQPKHQPADI